jgi:RNA:NAD 2'-phosphotransferase (TPT1/KptA family)
MAKTLSIFLDRSPKQNNNTLNFKGYADRKDFLSGLASPVESRFESPPQMCPEKLSKFKR